jgi:hypothetical protein
MGIRAPHSYVVYYWGESTKCLVFKNSFCGPDLQTFWLDSSLILKHMIAGQAIPRGLHVRLNLETGEREAKLLDENERTDLTLVPDDVQGRQLSQEDLQAALKDLPGEESSATIEVLQRISLKIV